MRYFKIKIAFTCKPLLIVIIKSLVCFILFINVNISNSQSLINNGDYFNNKAFLNTAYTGINGGYNASMLYKKQWSGFNNTPQYAQVNYDMAIPQINSGAGMSVINYKVGVFSDINLTAKYSYTLKINNDQNVYLGLGLNYLRSSINLSSATTTDRADPFYVNSNYSDAINGFNSSFGVGYRWQNLFTGLAINNLFTPKRGFTSYTYPVYREFKFFVTYNFEIDKLWTLESMLIPAYVSSRGMVFELATIGRFDKGLWFGLNVNRPLNYGFILGMNIDEHFYLNYLGGMSSQPTFANTTGNHEICLGYYFNNSQRHTGFNLVKRTLQLFGKKQKY